jgi:hypothetical protein
MKPIAPTAAAAKADSWESFAAMLHEESVALGRLNQAALALTQSLVDGTATEITAAERSVSATRRAYQDVSGKRRGMQSRGFGTMSLRQVCARAPRRLARVLNQRLYELSTLAIGLRITNANNKALIVNGLDRLMQVTAALQRAANDGPKTYRRRGYVAPPTNSVLVSSRV